jgi:hypothetical protein
MTMFDVLLILSGLGLFILAVGYGALCERL